MVDLGNETFPHDVNNAGQVAGFYRQYPSTDNLAFLWEDGTRTDLNDLLPPDSDWVLEWAYGINDAGWIVGYGRKSGELHAFLMVPEPATVSLLAAAGLAALRRRQRR